jgi:hypothetical protein
MPISFKNQTINNNKEKIMKKLLLALLSITIAFTAIQPAQAQDERVLAVIDSAINSNNFPSIIHEVCFTGQNVIANPVACPNGNTFMEGKGAAAVAWPTSINNGIYHGDQMVKSALTANPNIKIVFIRISNTDKNGNQNMLSSQVTSLVSAMNWVSQNAAKYSIDALSISQSSVSAGNLALCSTNTVAINAVASLGKSNIPVFVATGNDRRRDIVGFPACIEGVIGVGALANTVSGPFSIATQLETATNTGPGLDMVAPGKVTITKYNGSTTDTAGSSVATVVSAASYVSRNTDKTFGDYLTSLPKILIGSASYIRN